MKSRTLLAPVLTAFGLVLGAPALGDATNASDSTTAAPAIDVAIVDAPTNYMTLCVTLNSSDVPLPCVIRDDHSTLASVTLLPGDNFVLVPPVDPTIIGVTATSPDNPGIN